MKLDKAIRPFRVPPDKKINLQQGLRSQMTPPTM